MATTPEKPKFRDRLRQIGYAFTATREHDRKLVPLLLVAFIVPVAVGVVLGLVLRAWITYLPLGVLSGVVLLMVIFLRRVMKAQYAQLEGQLGAPAGIVQGMRGNWRVTPAVGFTPQQDLVHRVVGPPGVVLLVEGAPTRLKNIVVQEKKKVGRVAPEVPVYDIVVGDGEGEVPLRKLQSHLVKLPRNITPKQINAVSGRLDALGAARPPIPKGPLPKGARLPKGAKMPRGGR
jgi:hypothetical protein